MEEFRIDGVSFFKGPHAIGYASNGPSTADGAVRRIQARGMSNLSVLDICCGVGVIGLLMWKQLGPEVIRKLTLADINIFNLLSAKEAIRANGWSEAPIVTALSDGVMQLPWMRQFDLIVSNPPHVPQEFDALDPSSLATYDREWYFHRNFYKCAHEVLVPGGQIWMLENGNTAAETEIPPMIWANTRLELCVPWEQEPTDPEFYWMLSRRLVHW